MMRILAAPLAMNALDSQQGTPNLDHQMLMMNLAPTMHLSTTVLRKTTHLDVFQILLLISVHATRDAHHHHNWGGYCVGIVVENNKVGI
mmetsp:Transcript_19184/g.26972  ORF Transcript_19184/g.26972 Transcript_19184/m.26972 type:complete len:89 (+) Transcript_19184:473-739(+)